MRRAPFAGAAFLFLALFPTRLFEADNSQDLAIIDRALPKAHPDDPWVGFGDVGIKYSDLNISYRPASDFLVNFSSLPLEPAKNGLGYHRLTPYEKTSHIRTKLI